MVRKFLAFVVIVVLVVGGAKWLGEDGNGSKLGRTGGDLGTTGVDAVGGAGDAVTGFFDGITGK